MGIRKHLLVSAGRGTICGESLHRITIAGNQGLVIIPVNGCGSLCLESQMSYFTTGKLRHTHTYTAVKNGKGETIGLDAALEHEPSSKPP